jgi:hypothetical protein
MITVVTFIAVIAVLLGAFLTLAGFAAGMSDSPSGYASGNRDFIAGLVLFFLGAGWLLFQLVRAVLAWNWHG